MVRTDFPNFQKQLCYVIKKCNIHYPLPLTQSPFILNFQMVLIVLT